MPLFFVVAAAITGFVALCLLFFQATRKTYPGFGYWTAGVWLLALGYLLNAPRGQIPIWSAVFLGNFAFSLGMVLHLDGIRRFLGLKPASPLWYALPVAMLASFALFYFQWDSPTWRALFLAIALTSVHWTMAALIFRGAVRPRSVFYKVIGSLLSFTGLLVLVRSVWLVSAPTSDLIFKAPLEFAFFTSFIVLHLGESLSLIMLNAERVESELLEAKDELSQTVKSLKKALAQQKQAEESLRDSEQRYRGFFETSRDGVFMTSVDSRFVDFNDVCLEMLGLSNNQRHELLERRVSDLYAHPEEREALAAVERLRFSKENPVDLRRADGKIIHALVTTVARKDSEGNVIGFQGTVRDVTDRKKAEEALRESEQRLSLALDGANLGIWDWDLITGKAILSQRILQMLGYEPNEIESDLKNWKRLVHPDDWPRVSENFNLHIANGLPMFEVEHRILNKFGEWQWFNARGKVIESDEEGRPVRMTGIVVDSTERKLAEEKLRKSEERLDLALKGADLAIWDYNLKTGEAVLNTRRAEMVGYALEETEPHFAWWAKQVHPDDIDRVTKAFNDHAEGRSLLFECELRLHHKSGEYIWILARAKIVERDEHGSPARIVGTSLDITERKREEEEREALRTQLLQAQKMEAIGTLTGGIAHDFNNLLTIVNGYTELILTDTSEDDPIYKDLTKILETGHKGADMVQRLLAFSRKSESNPQPMDLNLLVENTVALMKRTFPKMIEIGTILSDQPEIVNADAGQMDQLLMNLCINAKEAMPDGGRLTIETGNTFIDEEYCRLHPVAKPGPHVRIEISDTGRGMSKETMERIFDPFFTSKGWDFKKGTGLGLSAAKGIVEQHGGWMTCQSEVGAGTKFEVYLPAIEDSSVVLNLEPPSDTVSDERKILLVDDEEYVRDVGKRILERAGYTVIVAGNGREALEIYAAAMSDIALVVLDLMMPQMGGEKCLQELLKINPLAKVIVSTGHSLDSQERLHLGALTKGFVNKPYEVRQLVQAIKMVLERGGSAE